MKARIAENQQENEKEREEKNIKQIEIKDLERSILDYAKSLDVETQKKRNLQKVLKTANQEDMIRKKENIVIIH